MLQVISLSAGELHGVFQTILANATRICEAKFGVMQLLEGDGLRAAAFHDVPSAYAEAMRRDPVFHPKVGHPLRRVMETKQVVHAPDARTEQNMRGRKLVDTVDEPLSKPEASTSVIFAEERIWDNLPATGWPSETSSFAKEFRYGTGMSQRSR